MKQAFDAASAAACGTDGPNANTYTFTATAARVTESAEVQLMVTAEPAVKAETVVNPTAWPRNPWNAVVAAPACRESVGGTVRHRGAGTVP